MKALKRILCMLVVTVLLALMICPVVFATDSSPGIQVQEDGQPIEYVTWAYIGTMAGATFVTTLIVQFLKVSLDYIWKIPTRIFVYFIAVIIMVAAECITQGGLAIDRTSIILVNAVIVTMASMGTYEATFRRVEKPG